MHSSLPRAVPSAWYSAQLHRTLHTFQRMLRCNCCRCPGAQSPHAMIMHSQWRQKHYRPLRRPEGKHGVNTRLTKGSKKNESNHQDSSLSGGGGVSNTHGHDYRKIFDRISKEVQLERHIHSDGPSHDSKSGLLNNADYNNNDEYGAQRRGLSGELRRLIKGLVMQEQWDELERLPSRRYAEMSEDAFRYLIYSLGVRVGHTNRAWRVWMAMQDWMAERCMGPSQETIQVMMHCVAVGAKAPLEEKMTNMRQMFEMLASLPERDESTSNRSFFTTMMYLLAKDTVDRSGLLLKQRTLQAAADGGLIVKIPDDIASSLLLLQPSTPLSPTSEVHELDEEGLFVKRYADIAKHCVEMQLHLRYGPYDPRREPMRRIWRRQLQCYFQDIVATGGTLSPFLLSHILKSYPHDENYRPLSDYACDRLFDIVSVAVDCSFEFDSVVFGTLVSAFIDHADPRAFKLLRLFMDANVGKMDFAGIEAVKRVFEKYPALPLAGTMPKGVMLSMLKRLMQRYPADWRLYDQTASQLVCDMANESNFEKLRMFGNALDLLAKLPQEAYDTNDIWQRVLHMLDEMAQNRIYPNHICASCILSIARRSGGGDRVFEAVEVLLDRGIKIRTPVILSLLDNLTEANDDRVFATYKALRSGDRSLLVAGDNGSPLPRWIRIVERVMTHGPLKQQMDNPDLSSVMIKACSSFAKSTGRISYYASMASDLFNETKDRHTVSDHTMSSILDLYATSAKMTSNPSELEQIKYQAMELVHADRGGRFLHRNVTHTNALLYVICLCGDLDLALNIVSQLGQEGMSPPAFSIVFVAMREAHLPFSKIRAFYETYERYSSEESLIAMLQMVDSPYQDQTYRWICDRIKHRFGTLLPSQVAFFNIVRAKINLGESPRALQNFVDRSIVLSREQDVSWTESDLNEFGGPPREVLECDLAIYLLLMRCCVRHRDPDLGLLWFDRARHLTVSTSMPQSIQERRERYFFMLHEYAISLCKWNGRYDFAKQLILELENRGREDFMVYASYAKLLLTSTRNSTVRSHPPFDFDEMVNVIQKLHTLATPAFHSTLREINAMFEEVMFSRGEGERTVREGDGKGSNSSAHRL